MRPTPEAVDTKVTVFQKLNEEGIQDFRDKVFLITGANGFLGRSLLNHLVNILASLQSQGLSSTHHIYAIDNGITSSSANVVDCDFLTFIGANAITYDYSQLKAVDYCLHLAGLASPAQYKKFPLETIDVAVSLTRTLLELCLKNKSKFLFFSSSEIYGNPDPDAIPTPEDYKGYVACQGPRACYDESKRMGETLCYVYNNYYGLHTNIVRPFNVYGPGMGKNDYRMIPNLMRSAIEGESIKIYGDGSQTRTFCYLDDAIMGILLIVLRGQPGETYNIGNPAPEVSIKDIVSIFNTSTGSSCAHEIIPYPESYPADEPMRRCPDISKAIEHLGYKPSVDLATGLSKTYEWALEAYSV